MSCSVEVCDRLIEFFDKGGTVDLGEGREGQAPSSDDTSKSEKIWGEPDKETIEKVMGREGVRGRILWVAGRERAQVAHYADGTARLTSREG